MVENSESHISTAYSVIVKFQTTLGTYDNYQPTALVEVGENGKVIRADINSFQIKYFDSVYLSTPDAALNVLKARLSSKSVNPSESKESTINLRNFNQLTVTQVTLEYTQGGGYLQPVYVFKGIGTKSKQLQH